MIKLKNNWDGAALIALTVLAFALIGLAIFAVFNWSEMAVLQPPENTKLEHFGQIGDFVGGLLNPALSLFAFIAVVISFRAQVRNAKATEGAAMALSVNQSEQLEQLVKQGRIAEKQAFENVYFGLAQIHSRNVESASVTIDASVLRGRDCFDAISKKFDLDEQLPPMMPARGAAFVQNYMRILDGFSTACIKGLGHYFRTVEQIIIYIDGAEGLSEEQKHKYFDMFVASLNEAEIHCLFMYIVRDRKFNNFELFHSYGFLNYHPNQALLTKMNAVGFFIVDGKNLA